MLRKSSNHLLFETKHELRHTQLFHPMTFELNTMAEQQEINEYYQLERRVMVQAIKQDFRWFESDINSFISRLILVAKHMRLRFLESHPSPHGSQYPTKEWNPSASWINLFQVDESRYGELPILSPCSIFSDPR